MRISIASDHAGFEQKEQLAAYLEQQGYEVVNEGPATDDRCDYPDYAEKVARDVNTGVADRGVLVCGTGLGMAIAADKVTGIRAVPVQTVQFAELCRQHNDANVICLSGRFVELEENQRILDTFFYRFRFIKVNRFLLCSDSSCRQQHDCSDDTVEQTDG